MSTTLANSDADILVRLIDPHTPSLPVDASKAILEISFPSSDVERMNELAEKARRGELSEAEQIEIDGYERVGHLLGILQSKARVSLARITQ